MGKQNSKIRYESKGHRDFSGRKDQSTWSNAGEAWLQTGEKEVSAFENWASWMAFHKTISLRFLWEKPDSK